MIRIPALCALAAIALTLSPALAQEARRGPWSFGLEGAGLYQFETDLEDQGSFSVARWFVQPSLGYAWDRRNTVAVSVGGGEYRYDFSGSASIGGAAPWDTIRDFRVGLPIRFAPAEQVDVIVIPSVRSFTESGVSLDDGRTEGVLAAGTWRFSPSFAIGPGLGWFSKLEGGSSVFPILAIDWDIWAFDPVLAVRTDFRDYLAIHLVSH